MSFYNTLDFLPAIFISGVICGMLLALSLIFFISSALVYTQYKLVLIDLSLAGLCLFAIYAVMRLGGVL